MNKPSQDAVELKIKDLEEENELLLSQLHQVQEELEVYFLKYKELESSVTNNIPHKTYSQNSSPVQWVDDELPEALAEVDRLTTLAAVQAEIKKIESSHSLNVRLGDLLIKSSKSIGGIIKLPFSLISFWMNESKKTPPAKLGGKDFTTLIKVYDEKSFSGVQDLLKDDKLSPFIKGNAYTVLARHLMKSNIKAAAESASKAYEVDPKPYRLKWLACRVHEAGDAKRADAMMQLLPENITFSDSENRQADQISYEASNIRMRDAIKHAQIVTKQEQVKNQITSLKSQLEKLHQERSVLAQEKETLFLNLQTAKKETNDLISRQKLFEDEVTRAEAQLDLIKNILLREIEAKGI